MVNTSAMVTPDVAIPVAVRSRLEPVMNFQRGWLAEAALLRRTSSRFTSNCRSYWFGLASCGAGRFILNALSALGPSKHSAGRLKVHNRL